jgi:hypothetical protein
MAKREQKGLEVGTPRRSSSNGSKSTAGTADGMPRSKASESACLAACTPKTKPFARRKLARLAEGNTTREEAQRPETFEEAARRVLDEQKSAGMVTHKDRLYRLETYAFPTLAKMQPSAIRAAHVRSLLEEARNGGKARQTLTHIKNAGAPSCYRRTCARGKAKRTANWDGPGRDHAGDGGGEQRPEGRAEQPNVEWIEFG